MTLERLAEKLAAMEKPTPLWKGPEVDGITQSLLGGFLVDRERFRLRVIEGICQREGFSKSMEFGNMWHVCEEAIATDVATGLPADQANLWRNSLNHHTETLVDRFPAQADQIEHWRRVVEVQFPYYVEYWRKFKLPDKTPLLSEAKFSVPYQLPSGRTVILRGKWDSVDFMPAHTDSCGVWPAGIWLQENKTKGSIDELQITRQLDFDLQTMFYLVALEAQQRLPDGPLDPSPIIGVRYNVVQRPLSGEKGTIKQLKFESKNEYYARLAEYFRKEPQRYFMRWPVGVSQTSLATFRRQCLDPILRQLCDWYDWVAAAYTTGRDPFTWPSSHWRHPYGVYNPLNEGHTTDLDHHLATGSMVGLERVTNLFPELAESP